MYISAVIVSFSSLLSFSALALAAPVVEQRAAAVDDDRFTLYDLPTALTGPCDLVHGPDGALWGQVSGRVASLSLGPVPF